MPERKLEEALGLKLDRYEPARRGLLNYAQINIPDGEDVWKHLTDVIDRIGPTVVELMRSGDIGQPSADVAMGFNDDYAATSLLIPSGAAGALGRWNFAIEISVYLTSSDRPVGDGDPISA